jgi:hypothetical protein
VRGQKVKNNCPSGKSISNADQQVKFSRGLLFIFELIAGLCLPSSQRQT